MNARWRWLFLVLLLTLGSWLGALLYLGRHGTPLQSTFTSLFQLAGVPVKLADRSLSRVIPVGSLDERELGDTLRQRYESRLQQPGQPDRDQAYLDALIVEIAAHARKPFSYRAYVVDDPAPNAMAMPGGVLLVTRGLLATLGSEAELVAVLAHELGHVELGHCFDAVRFQLLAQKVGATQLGGLADFALGMLTSHAYSKTMEDEADRYAWKLLLASRYDPAGVGDSFESLRRHSQRHGHVTPSQADLFRDYFMSHPPLELRAEKYAQSARQWWSANRSEQRYRGLINLAQRQSMAQATLAQEWARHP